MLFYERRSKPTTADDEPKINCGPSSECIVSPIGTATAPIPSCSSAFVEPQPHEANKKFVDVEEPLKATTSTIKTAENETESVSDLSNSNLTPIQCDIDIKSNNSSQKGFNNALSIPLTMTSFLSKELEEWIWQDNRHFLQDRNIFEHTYFKLVSGFFSFYFVSYVSYILQFHVADLRSHTSNTSVAYRRHMQCHPALCVILYRNVHSCQRKGKTLNIYSSFDYNCVFFQPTMVLWVELLTKQFNANQEACEWFLTHMSTEPWWPVQVLIQCPNQMVRQMFQRLVIHVIQRLRQSNHTMYLKTEKDEDDKEIVGNASCVTRFIKSLILLMEHGAKAHLRHLSEFFGLLYEFSRMGDEEGLFLLKINVIRSVADFYLGHKTQDCVSWALLRLTNGFALTALYKNFVFSD